MKKAWLGLGVLVAAIVGGALAAAPASADDPLTPLGKWMKQNMGALMAPDTKDFTAIKAQFDFVIGKVPSGAYGQWATFSQAGSAAAAASDLKAVKAACKGCHDAHKRQYKTEHATDPFP
jgi:hypothetical protein